MDEHRDQQHDPAADDEALARLRAADPAADAGLDAAALRAEVARRTAGDPADGDPGTVVPLAGRRRARWLQVAAVAAAAAVVAGAGGYAVGAGGGDGGTVTADAPITLSGPAAEGATAMDGAASTADLRIAPWFGGRTVFSSSGLADDAASAHAWAFDAASVFSAETAARVAGVLGVAGEPAQQLGAWTVGPQDGSGPTVTLQPDGTAGISYYDPTRDPWACAASAPDEPDAGGTGDGGSGAATAEPGAATLDPALVDPALPTLVAPSCDPAAGPAPTGEAATSAVRDLLGSLGVDPDGFQYEALEGDARASTVTAAQVLDGQQTGLTWSVTLVEDGVQSLYGSLAPLVDLGEYPVVGAATAAERLNDPRFGAAGGGVMPLARAEAADGAASGALREGTAADAPATLPAPGAGDPTVPATAAPGAAIPWPVQQVTLTGARLGVSMVTGADGAALLVPAYELTDADGSSWSVVAVDEGSLDLAG